MDLKEFRGAVSRNVVSRQDRFLGGDASARSDLARMRSAFGRDVGDEVVTWRNTVDVTASEEPAHVRVSAAEQAAYWAMALHALHQQGNGRRGMHGRGSVGAAFVALRAADSRGEAVNQRFERLLGLDEPTDLVSALRGTVAQFAAAVVPLDYGQLAVDLLLWRTGSGRATTRARWGRDYYSNPSSTTSASTQTQEN